MFLYHLTLQKPGAITKAIFGNFSAKGAQEFVVIRGHTLELLRPNEVGDLQCVCSTHAFGVLRDVVPFRVTGASVDHVVIASDSGRITVVKFDAAGNRFEGVHLETFGKTGCRRITPGQFLAVDPNGRALLIAALEKQKLVYVMNRDASERLTISSPLEAHKAKTLLFDVVGVDVGFENPVFACLELDYSDVDVDPSGEALAASEKFLTFYELDLGGWEVGK
jgi:splicing factor 3B subunit 3